jgi:putative membrane protein
LDKIQQVNINQSFIQRLINVYEINVDTVGVLKRSPNKSNHAFIGISLKEDFRKQNMEVATNEGISNVEAIQKRGPVHQH